MCAKGLTSLIHKATFRGNLHGATICQNAPTVSHLLFADDSMLFFQENQEEAQVMKNNPSFIWRGICKSRALLEDGSPINL